MRTPHRIVLVLVIVLLGIALRNPPHDETSYSRGGGSSTISAGYLAVEVMVILIGGAAVMWMIPWRRRD